MPDNEKPKYKTKLAIFNSKKKRSTLLYLWQNSTNDRIGNGAKAHYHSNTAKNESIRGKNLYDHSIRFFFCFHF